MVSILINSRIHDPRLKSLVALSGDPSLFNDTNVPYFTRRNWARDGRINKMTTCELLEKSKAELIIQVMKLTAKCIAISANNQLLKMKIDVFGVNTDWKRLPASGKKRLLTAVASAREVINLKDCLNTLNISGKRFHNWIRRTKKCQLQDYKTCPKSSPAKLTIEESKVIKSLFLAKDYTHFSIRSLALYALINGYVACSPSTWYRQIKENKWPRSKNSSLPKRKKDRHSKNCSQRNLSFGCDYHNIDRRNKDLCSNFDR